MISNQDVIRSVYKRLIEIGSAYSSKDYIFFILSEITRELGQKNEAGKFIEIYHYDVIIDEKIEQVPEEQVNVFIKEILNSIGMKLITLEFKNSLDQDVLSELLSRGVTI